MVQRLPVAILWLLIGLSPVQGEDVPAVAERPDPAEFVARLGHPAFQVRERAAQDLRSFGMRSIPALEAAVAAPDLEVRYRVQRLIDEIAEQEQEGRLARFAREPDAVPDDFLPGLGRARALFATDEAGRQLFIAMHRSEPRLFRAMQRGGSALEAAFTTTAAEHQFSFSRSRPPEGIRVAALLFVASTPGLKVSSQSASFLCTQLNYAEFKKLQSDRTHGSSARKLLSVWIGKRGEAAAFQRVAIALQNDVPEGLQPALEILDGPPAAGALQYAMIAVGRFGSREHLPVLEKQLTRDDVISTQRDEKRVVFETQVRDFALATLLHLTDQEPRDYGFRRLQENDQYLFLPHTVGFTDSAARQAALDKWAKWRDAHAAELGPVASEAEVPMPGTTD